MFTRLLSNTQIRGLELDRRRDAQKVGSAGSMNQDKVLGEGGRRRERKGAADAEKGLRGRARVLAVEGAPVAVDEDGVLVQRLHGAETHRAQLAGQWEEC